MNETISVLMTVFNNDIFVKKSIQSILGQTYDNFEFIIVDDGSTDKSYEMLNSINDKRLKIYRLKKKIGRTKALNFGLKKCNTNIISIQDSDDISNNDRLEKTMKIFSQNQNVGLVFTNYDFINSKGEIIEDRKSLIRPEYFRSDLTYMNVIAHSSVTFKRNFLSNEKIFYDESFIYAQDYHLILRFLKDSKLYLINEKLLRIRDHKKNMSNLKIYAKIRLLENLKLLNFSKKNLNLNFSNKLKIKLNEFKNYFKLLKIFLGE